MSGRDKLLSEKAENDKKRAEKTLSKEQTSVNKSVNPSSSKAAQVEGEIKNIIKESVSSESDSTVLSTITERDQRAIDREERKLALEKKSVETESELNRRIVDPLIVTDSVLEESI